jgi:hypothetical protein
MIHLSYGQSIIQKIIRTPNQELATHTFSHYYCLEPGQTIDQFSKDLEAVNKIHKREGNNPISIVFPEISTMKNICKFVRQIVFYAIVEIILPWIYKAQAKVQQKLFGKEWQELQMHT